MALSGPKRRPPWGSKDPVLGVRMNSEDVPFLDPIKLLVILDPGPEVAILQCKCANSQHGQNC